MDKIWIAVIFIPSILILKNMTSKNGSFLDLRKVIKNHFLLFKDCKYQYAVFYIYPVFIAAGIAYKFTPESSFMEQLNVVVSILLSALLAIMGILVSKSFNALQENQFERAKRILTETNNAIIFDVFIGIVLIIINLVLYTVDLTNMLWGQFLAGISYYLLIVMLLNILLIIKRLSNLSDL
ncbi:MAG: hypothetical protein K6D38_09335 [Pseudobutyrivibrio sp.]|nr:hypothetical protein [Pseudobutyrivibrio sp.]